MLYRPAVKRPVAMLVVGVLPATRFGYETRSGCFTVRVVLFVVLLVVGFVGAFLDHIV